jgi:hypothetical protein
MIPKGVGDSVPLMRCTRDEYGFLARYCGTLAEARSILMDNGVVVGSRSNRYYYVSPVAFEVAAGRKLSGRASKNRNPSESRRLSIAISKARPGDIFAGIYRYPRAVPPARA